jgi:hypothetical protein
MHWKDLITKERILSIFPLLNLGRCFCVDDLAGILQKFNICLPVVPPCWAKTGWSPFRTLFCLNRDGCSKHFNHPLDKMLVGFPSGHEHHTYRFLRI